MKKQKNKLQVNSKIYYILLFVVLFAVFSFFLIKGKQKINISGQPASLDATSTTSNTPSSDGTCDYRRKIDGECVHTEQEALPFIIGVMVENHNDANPLSGIAKASVVYEAPVEGNFPRFLALYPLEEKVDKVGPVRSARPYYLDWVSEWGDAMYMHVGGSNEALEKIKQFNIFDVDEFFNAKLFWRDRVRSAPHNTYTSSELWQKARNEKGQNRHNESYTGLHFEEKQKCSENCVQEVAVTFAPGYDIMWKYNAKINMFERYQNSARDKDLNGDAYNANNVIVQKVQMSVLDTVGRRKIDTVAEGEAVYFINGNMSQGRWKKNSRTEPTQWLDKEGNEMSFVPGKTWIEVAAQNMMLSWK